MSTDAARTKLRELIATKQQWLRQWQAPELLSPGRSDMIHILSDNIAELQQVLAELDKAEPQEPVATVVMRHYIDGTSAHSLKWNSRNGEDDLPVGTKLYTTPPASEMRLIHHVFGEFREPLYQIRKAVMKGNSGEALQLLGDLENQMFKI